MIKILGIIVLGLLYDQNVYANIFGTKDIIKFSECYPSEYNSYKKYKNSEDNIFDEWSWEINLKKDTVTRTVLWSDKKIAIAKKNGHFLKKIDIDSFPILSSSTNFVVITDKNYEFTLNIQTGHIQTISKNTSNLNRVGTKCKIS